MQKEEEEMVKFGWVNVILLHSITRCEFLNEMQNV